MCRKREYMSNRNEFQDHLTDLKEDLEDRMNDFKDELTEVSIDLKETGIEFANSLISSLGSKRNIKSNKLRGRKEAFRNSNSGINLIRLECPSCGANLDNVNVLNPGKCAYCGEPILIESDARLSAELELRELENEKYKFDKRYEHRKEVAKQSRKLLFILLPFLIFVGLLPVSILGIGSYMDHKKIERLEAIEQQVEEYFLDKNYEAALLKANQLVYDGTWSDSEGDKWDEKRKRLIQVIEKAMEEDRNY